MKKRVWFDLEIGTNPDSATALLFALKHPDLDVLGISISGSEKSQPARLQEAKAVLDYALKPYTSLYLGEEIDAEFLTGLKIDHTITTGRLTNSARLILDGAELGQINIRAGAFSKVNYRGNLIIGEENITKDMDAARIVLSQYENIVISAFDASNDLVLSDVNRKEIEEKHEFLKDRYDGFEEFLKEKHGDQSHMILHALLPVCDVLNLVGITREVIEFKIQADGSFLSTHELKNVLDPVSECIQAEGEERIPSPKVKHEVIRAVNPEIIFEELLRYI